MSNLNFSPCCKWCLKEYWWHSIEDKERCIQKLMATRGNLDYWIRKYD